MRPLFLLGKARGEGPSPTHALFSFDTGMIRRLTLAAISVLAILTYLLLLWASPGLDHPVERTFNASAGGDHVQLYLELVGIEAVRSAIQVRLSIEPHGLAIDAKSMLPDRDLILNTAHDKRGERITVHAQQPMQTTSIELDLYGGDVADYPLDAYHASLSIQCLDASGLSGAQPSLLPVDVTVWERVLGFRVRTSEQTVGASGEGRLTFRIRRSSATVFFALAAYGAMVVLACVAATVGTLTFLGVRRPEATLMGAMGAIVFALPALRNTLPGGPPLGVAGDVLVFLWAELAAVIALVLLVAAWARSGPSP